jgi:peroxiredoxin Q/BCP
MKRFLMTIMIATAAVTLKAGDPAPDFKAVATDGKTISLSDYVGKQNLVLYFYPKDMTGGCTREACNFRDDLSKYTAANTAILGVSMDSREMHLQFTQKDSLTFPLLVDTSGAICKAYGVPYDGHYAHRWTFLIGKDGKIIKTYQDVDPRIHSTELLADIAAHEAH